MYADTISVIGSYLTLRTFSDNSNTFPDSDPVNQRLDCLKINESLRYLYRVWRGDRQLTFRGGGPEIPDIHAADHRRNVPLHWDTYSVATLLTTWST